ncbi:FAD-binding oxidoreductase [Mesobacillus foraminis]|uniref:NAD(P)/FAD-dependent oxidoreductase n=1 Tax=Mesobacillus foraminis TaxID=279826 RepID=UPI00399F5B51
MKRFIVVGGGILGASTAYQLVKKGADVTIVDRRDKGQATDAAAGIVCPWLSQRRNKAWYQLAKSGARFYPELIEELERDGETETGYARVGAISLHKDEDKLLKMMERASDRKPDAPEMGEITQLSKEETQTVFPLLDKEFGSVQVSGAARVDGRALRDSLISGAKKNGAAFIEGEAQLEFNNKTVIGIKTDGRFIDADAVIVCAGAWANELLHPLGIDLKVTFQKAQIIHMQMPEGNTDNWPVVMPPGSQYLLAFENQRLVAGATHEDTEEFDTRITAGGMQEVLNKALEIAPGLSQATYLETRTGFRPFTPGFLPMIGRVPGWEGVLAANGLGASGLTMGPYIGSQLAKLAMGEELDIDLSLYAME